MWPNPRPRQGSAHRIPPVTQCHEINMNWRLTSLDDRLNSNSAPPLSSRFGSIAVFSFASLPRNFPYPIDRFYRVATAITSILRMRCPVLPGVGYVGEPSISRALPYVDD